ncbi:MAG TPA: hydrogenase expression/formation C-terminal domain-containing protein [Novimethylophilus sp.]|jgi:hydrogenase-1 operon protein HyaF|uniref:hydrogenase expression/formation protein n=1 Tax=Novimethylophilus sp. TaxID=2137426 RepID=UPI002F40C166
MREFPIPVVAFGPGSHPEADEAEFLPMPRDMEAFSMPSYNLEADPQTLAAACGLIERLCDAMLHVPLHGPGRPRIELMELAPQVVELVNQSLGHGEVSILVREPVTLRIQETVFAGIWRVQELSPQGILQRDAIVAGAIPYAVQQSAELAASNGVKAPPLRDGIMNAPAILNELLDKSRSHQAGQSAHVVNFSLLPVSPEDMEYLFEAFGVGPVTILSRGYGNCRITSTRLAHVWWVQYFNSMDQIILNTIEVVDVPEAAQAAAEDYADSMERLGEWLAAMKAETV